MHDESNRSPQLPSRRGIRRVVAGSLLGLVGFASGCTTVAPSQRGYLAKPEMNPAGEPSEESFHSHIEAAREGAMGGHGVQGGGCGCG